MDRACRILFPSAAAHKHLPQEDTVNKLRFNEYINVPLDLAERVKARAKGVDGISVKAVLMPKTKVRKRLIITAKMHSWYASSMAMGRFLDSLGDDSASIKLYRKSSIC